MKKTNSILAIVPMMAALCLSARAEDAKPAPAAPPVVAPAAPPATLEKQIEYLEGALAEGIKSKDWKMTEMAVAGFKSAGVTGKDLELSMLRAEKQAALESVYQTDLRAQIEIWGLVSRAKLGDTAALESVRKTANEKIVPVATPNAADYTKNPKQYQEQQKAQLAYAAARGKQDAALLALALLKEPNVLPQAIAALRGSIQERTGGYTYGYGYNQNPLVLAALVSDANEGWKALLETVEAPELAPESQFSLVQMLLNIAHPMQGFVQPTAFQVDAEIAGTLPKDAVKQLWKPLIAAMKRYAPDNNPQHAGVAYSNLYTIPMVVDRMMAISENQEAITALEELKGKVTGQMAQYVNQQIDSVVNKHRKGVAPPKSPDTF